MMRIPSEKVCKAPDCSNNFLQYKSTQKVCSVQCAIALAKEKAYQKKLTEARIAKREWHEKNITVQKLVGKVQREYFNPWIRRRDAGKKCISCHKILEGKYDAGHYYPSTHFSLRFDEANVHGQCVKCNQYLHGNLIEYRKGLIKRIGMDEVLRLDSMAHQTRKWSREELLDLMLRYPKQKK
jgi:hypothetical protein